MKVCNYASMHSIVQVCRMQVRKYASMQECKDAIKQYASMCWYQIQGELRKLTIEFFWNIFGFNLFEICILENSK